VRTLCSGRSETPTERNWMELPQSPQPAMKSDGKRSTGLQPLARSTAHTRLASCSSRCCNDTSNAWWHALHSPACAGARPSPTMSANVTSKDAPHRPHAHCSFSRPASTTPIWQADPVVRTHVMVVENRAARVNA
jgi:hypothetical protein